MSDDQLQKTGTVLVIGATGYVGSRLVPMLLSEGVRVRAAGRSLEKLATRSWATNPMVELHQLDLKDLESTRQAVEGCDVVYYLMHSMNPESKDFAQADKLAAGNMVKVGEENGLCQLIYLGGLGEDEANLSKHLRSRAEVAEILRGAKFPVTILRAAMIIGSGSASFEILRYLTDRLPVMVTPRWVSTTSQPIAIRNVLHYLLKALRLGETFDRTFDIGGPEVLTYRQLMETYAREAGLPVPIIVPVPVFTPRLSSYWINFVTPVPAYIARPLAEGLRNPAVCRESKITEIIPQDLLTCAAAIKIAIDRIQHHKVESHWTDAGRMPPVEWFSSSDPQWAGGAVFSDVRRVTIEGTAADAWKAVARIGGTTGWYYANWLWRLRGLLDFLWGGIGLRLGRRDPDELRTGDAVDFWRVKSAEREKRLLLIAEMKLPGEAALEFQIKQTGENRTEILQIARFLPSGLLGLAYWFAVSPLHEFIFTGMLSGVAKASQREILEKTRKSSLQEQTLQLKAVQQGEVS
ncbi:MAG: SDR family oxidoreductase [Candidatus Melainabacteria bacterium]|nr:SDR family oxidoreductase [Candidatus Melainabacteria bacterium]